MSAECNEINGNNRPARSSRRGCMLSTATRLFAQNGFTSTTIRQIARECGVTEAAIYKHFNSKEHLYEEVIRSKSSQHCIEENLQNEWADDGVEKLLAKTARHILDTAKNDPELLRMFLFSSLEGFSDSKLLYNEFRQPYILFLRRRLQALLKAGQIRRVNAFITSRCFVGMVMDCALNAELWNNLENTSFSAENTVKNNVPIFARGLLPDVDKKNDSASRSGGKK